METLPEFSSHLSQRSARAFRSAVPALDIFPIELWTRTVSHCLRKMPPRQLSYGDAFGFKPLRDEIAAYLTAARGVRCHPDQIMIVNGSQQALSLCARVLLDCEQEAWVEDPGYFGITSALRAAEAALVPVPVDQEGMRVERAIAIAPHARAAFVTPSRQLPLGVTMSLPRRLALLSWAKSNDAWVVEDDYDSEFRYTSRPLGALQGLDTEGCVVYAGTFSKVMFPALRLGYVVVPGGAHDAFYAMRRVMDFQSAYLEQAAMAEFIRQGHFDRHIRRTRQVYAARLRTLVDALEAQLSGRVTPGPADAGMTLVVWLQPDDNEAEVVKAIAEEGVHVIGLSELTIEHRCAPAIVLGFSGIPEDEIVAGVGHIAIALERLDRSRRSTRASA